MAISGHSAGRCAAWFQTLNLDLEPVSRYPPRCVDANPSVAAEYSIAFRTTRILRVMSERSERFCYVALRYSLALSGTRFTNPTPHKWEGNIRAQMLSTTFAPFTLFDSDDHSLTVDIRDLQADRLRDAQSGSVAGRKDRAMLDTPHTA